MLSKTSTSKSQPAPGLRTWVAGLDVATWLLNLIAAIAFLPWAGNHNGEYGVRSSNADPRAALEIDRRRWNMFRQEEILELGVAIPYFVINVLYIAIVLMNMRALFKHQAMGEVLVALFRGMSMFMLTFLMCLVAEVEELGSIIFLSVISGYASLALTMYIGEEEEGQSKESWREFVAFILFFAADLFPASLLLNETLTILPESATNHRRSWALGFLLFWRVLWWARPLKEKISFSNECIRSTRSSKKGYKRTSSSADGDDDGVSMMCTSVNAKRLTILFGLIVFILGFVTWWHAGPEDHASHAFFYRITNAPGSALHPYKHFSVDWLLILNTLFLVVATVKTYSTLVKSEESEFLCVAEALSAAVWIALISSTGVVGDVTELLGLVVVVLTTGLDLHVFSAGTELTTEKALEWFYVVFAFVFVALSPFVWILAKTHYAEELPNVTERTIWTITLMLIVYRITVFTYAHFYKYNLSPSAKNGMKLLLIGSLLLTLGAQITLLYGVVDETLYVHKLV